jgi:hypothetical protein
MMTIDIFIEVLRVKWWEIAEIILRWLYYLAGVGLIFTLILGIRQLRLLQSDMKIRNQRASFEKTIEYLDWYSEFFDTLSKFRRDFNEMGKSLSETIPPDKQKMFIESVNIEYDGKVEPDDTFSDFKNEFSLYKTRVDVMKIAGALDVLNQLEIFAAVMNCRIADEEMAFTPLSDAYCQTVQSFYLVLCQQRGENPKLYSNIVGLYRMWQSRIDKNNIEDEINQKFARLSQLTDNKKPPLGV